VRFHLYPLDGGDGDFTTGLCDLPSGGIMMRKLLLTLYAAAFVSFYVWGISYALRPAPADAPCHSVCVENVDGSYGDQ
jgi:hypothetical protein